MTLLVTPTRLRLRRVRNKMEGNDNDAGDGVGRVRRAEAGRPDVRCGAGRTWR